MRSHSTSTALSKGGLPWLLISLMDCRWAGLVIHSLAIGVVSTVLPLTVYPFLTAYLNMEGTQTLSARTLLAMPWFFRPLFRILIDCAPLIRGEHHRPFLTLGWLVASASLGGIYWIGMPAPFYGDTALVGTPRVNMTPLERASLHEDAPSHGAIYVLLMTVATIGFVLADVAADALIHELGPQFVPPLTPSDESPLVSRVTMPRYAAMLFSFLFMGFGMSGRHFGGDFSFSLRYTEVMLITAVFAAVPTPCTWLGIADVNWKRHSVTRCLRRTWGLVQNCAIANVLICRFLGGVLGGISATPVNPIALYWAHVQPLNDNVVSFVATTVVIGFVALADKKGWVINYRVTLLSANAVILVLDCGATLFTIWDVVRSQWFWIGLPVLEALPSGLDYVLVTIVLGEMTTEPGTDELARSLVTAVSFLATPFALALTKYIDVLFDVTNEDLASDTTHVRMHVTVVFLIAYVCQLLSLAWLSTLPRERDEARKGMQESQPSSRRGALVLAVFVLSLAWSIAAHVLSVMDSTSCLWIAGGKGCEKSQPGFLHRPYCQ